MRGLYNDLDYGNWSSLPFSESEANYIEKYLLNTTTLTGSKANEKYKSLNLKDYDIIHFATHGIVVGDRPELNAIVLSQNNSDEEDGYLRSEEIEQLEIDASLVVLSACETA